MPFGKIGEREKEIRIIPQGTVVWPEKGRGGVAQHDVLVRRLNVKVKGLSGFELINPLTLYLDEQYWTLRAGTRVGVHTKNVSRVKK